MDPFSCPEGITIDYINMINCDFEDCLRKLQIRTTCSDLTRLFQNDNNILELMTYCLNETLAKLLDFSKKLQREIDNQKIMTRHWLFCNFNSSAFNINTLRERIFQVLSVDQKKCLSIVDQIHQIILESLQIKFDSRSLEQIMETNRNISKFVIRNKINEKPFCQNMIEDRIEIFENSSILERQQNESIDESISNSTVKDIICRSTKVNQENSLEINNNRNQQINSIEKNSNISCQNSLIKNDQKKHLNFASILKHSSPNFNSYRSETSNISCLTTICVPNLTQSEEINWIKQKVDLMNEKLLNPWGVMFCSKNHYLYICDRCTNRILVVDQTNITKNRSYNNIDKKLTNKSNENSVRQFGNNFCPKPYFNRPSSIHHDILLDRLIVVDKDHHQIQIFERSSERHLFSFGEKGTKNGRFLYPWDVTTDMYSNIYISDSKNSRIQVFDCQGNYLRKITGHSTKKINSPRGLTFVNNDNILLITDFEMHKLISIKLTFTNKNQINVDSMTFHNKIQLQRPQSIDYYNGMVAIADSRCYEIKVYNLDTQQRLSILPDCDTEGIYPGGVCFGGNEAIFVSEIEKNEIYRFVLDKTSKFVS